MNSEEQKDTVKAPWKYTGPETLTLALSREVKLAPSDQNPITEINLTEPTIEQMMAYEDARVRSRNNFEAGMILIQKNANITLAQAKKLSTRDFEAALDFLTGFTTPPQMDGEI